MHNYNVDHKYKFQTRIGNWFEEWELDETKKKDYLKNRQNGQLASIVKDQKTNFSLRLASLTFPKDEYIHFGFHIMLQNLKTQGFLSIDIQEKLKIAEEAYNVTTAPATQPTVRSVFVVVPYILNE